MNLAMETDNPRSQCEGLSRDVVLIRNDGSEHGEAGI